MRIVFMRKFTLFLGQKNLLKDYSVTTTERTGQISAASSLILYLQKTWIQEYRSVPLSYTMLDNTELNIFKSLLFFSLLTKYNTILPILRVFFYILFKLYLLGGFKSKIVHRMCTLPNLEFNSKKGKNILDRHQCVHFQKSPKG